MARRGHPGAPRGRPRRSLAGPHSPAVPSILGAEGARGSMANGKSDGNGAGAPHREVPKRLAKHRSPEAETASVAVAFVAPKVPDKSRVYSHPALANHLARKVAVEADCDPRAVFKYLWGMPQHALMRERIERALTKTGHADLVGYATRMKVNASMNARVNGKA